MSIDYSNRILQIYNKLAERDLAKETHFGLWLEAKGVKIYQNGRKKDHIQQEIDNEDTYCIRIEMKDGDKRIERTRVIKDMFKDDDFVTVLPPKKNNPRP